MGINTVQTGSRTVSYDMHTTANGSYTLPKYAFIPHASLQQLSGPIVNSPSYGSGVVGADYAAMPAGGMHPYPIPAMPSVYGIRVVNTKMSP